jgi:glycosyltransferase involved in cell wall biosynthesis
LSGISYYTHALAEAFSDAGFTTAVILMRQLVPTRLYPGHRRVGLSLTEISYRPEITVANGVDWFWGPSMLRAMATLVRFRPSVLILQWWTGSVLHSYLALVVIGRILGTRVLVEFHESLDTGEIAMPVARAYVRSVAPILFRLCDGFIVHSDFDRSEISAHYQLRRPIRVVPHGPFRQHLGDENLSTRSRTDGTCHILFFGVIREYKGVEDLVEAFGRLKSRSDNRRYHLTVVGETWERWTRPAELIERSSVRDDITFVNRYVTDEELATFLSDTDVVALPYRRSSASGPLHLAMSHGLPVVVTSVGGLTEAVKDYEGAITIPPNDPESLCRALVSASHLVGRRFQDPHSWQNTIDVYREFFVDTCRRP